MFKANITIGTVTTGTAKNGKKFSTARDCTQTLADGSTRSVVLMAFGAQRDAIIKSLRKGRKADLMVVRDGGVLKAIGYPKAKQAA